MTPYVNPHPLLTETGSDDRGDPSNRLTPAQTAPGLYLVAMPIGHLRDITLRALDVLQAADLVACEDTRILKKLLNRYGLKPKLTAYHEYNATKVRPRLLQLLTDGAVVALTADAGMPLISDPGYRLVTECIARSINVTVIPGPSAGLAALVLSGLPSDRFLFAGFPPARKAQRRAFLADLAAVPTTLILFESIHRLSESLKDMADLFGNRSAVIARELTKRHETVLRGPLQELAAIVAKGDPLKGEIVLVIGPPESPAPSADPVEIDRLLDQALQTATVKDAAAMVAEMTGAAKRHVYQRAIDLRRRENDPGEPEVPDKALD